MNKAEAEQIVANEDYLPWALVSEAKRLLGIHEPTAGEIMAEVLKAKECNA